MQKKKIISKFTSEVSRFREWAVSYKDTSGEWECDYGNWDSIYLATDNLLKESLNTNFQSDLLDDLIYIIARDNECEIIREKLTDFPDLLRVLAFRALDSEEWHAKWQIVVSVHEANLMDASDLIRPYLKDKEEYVRRRSLAALAYHSPLEAESIAKENMNGKYEYTRIMGLNVLKIVESDSLEFYLKRHENDPDEYVRNNVQEIREEIEGLSQQVI